MNKDSIIVSLPYPYKFLGVTFFLKRKIGFLFTNLATFQFRENAKFKTDDDYKKWLKENGQSRLISEMMYGAAQAYCLTEKKEQNFTKEKLIAAVSVAGDEIQKKILDGWERSQTFGAVLEKKKLIKTKR